MTLQRRNRPVQITDAPEHRNIPLDRVEMRESEDENEFILEGYASTFEEYEMYGGPERYGWIERIDKGAFDKTLREKPDLHLLLNHQGAPLARTKSGTCDLSVDDHGLKVVARLDKRDPEAQSLWVKMDRGDMDEMSFAFRVKDQEWSAAPGFEDLDDDETYRLITEVSLHKGDVSVVNFGANPTTSVNLRSALEFLAECDEKDLTEIRSNSEVMARLGRLNIIENLNVENIVRSEEAVDETEVDEALSEWLEAERVFTQSWLDAEAEFLAESDVADTPPIHVERQSSDDADFAARWAIYKEALDAGVMTVNEVREALGFPPIEGAPADAPEEREDIEDVEERDEEQIEDEASEPEVTEEVEKKGISLRFLAALEDD